MTSSSEPAGGRHRLLDPVVQGPRRRPGHRTGRPAGRGRPSGRHRGRPRGLVGRPGHGGRRRRPDRRARRSSVGAQQHGMVALDAAGARRPAGAAVERRPQRAAGAAMVGRIGAAGLGRRRGQRAAAVLHHHQAGLAGRARAGPRRGRGVGAAPPRLADLAPARAGRRARRPTAATPPARATGPRRATSTARTCSSWRSAIAASLPRVLGPPQEAGRTAGGGAVGPGAGDNAAAALGPRPGARRGRGVARDQRRRVRCDHVPTHDGTGIVAGFADATGRQLPLVLHPERRAGPHRHGDHARHRPCRPGSACAQKEIRTPAV